MEKWNTIEEVADNFQITERTAWRWLKSGKIVKHVDTDSNKPFFTVNENEVNTDYDDDSGDMSVSGVSIDKSKPLNPLLTLKNELKSRKIELEISQLEDIQERQKERREAKAREKLERERLERQQEALLKEKARKENEEKREILRTMKIVRDFVLCDSIRETIPSEILPKIYSELDKYFRSINVLSYSYDELIEVAGGIVNQVANEYDNEQKMLQRELEREEYKWKREEQERDKIRRKVEEEMERRIKEEKDLEVHKIISKFDNMIEKFFFKKDGDDNN